MEKDVLAAKESVFIQTLSFEGDTIGKRLCDLLMALLSHIDIKILIDRFIFFRINDRWVSQVM